MSPLHQEQSKHYSLENSFTQTQAHQATSLSLHSTNKNQILPNSRQTSSFAIWSKNKIRRSLLMKSRLHSNKQFWFHQPQNTTPTHCRGIKYHLWQWKCLHQPPQIYPTLCQMKQKKLLQSDCTQWKLCCKIPFCNWQESSKVASSVWASNNLENTSEQQCAQFWWLTQIRP